MLLENLRGKLLLSLALGLAVVVGVMVYADIPQLAQALARFQWHYLPAILGLTLMNYALRFIKWDYYLHQIGVTNLSKLDSLFIFFSGLSMVITPGKVGEWVKCYLVRDLTSVPFSKTAPIVIAERLTDGVAMALLAMGGLLVFGIGWQVILAMLLLATTIVVAARYRPLALSILLFLEKLPLISKGVKHLHQFYESSHILLSPKNLLFAITLGFVSWFGEGIAFYFVLKGLGLESSWLLLIQACFILAASIIAGSLLLLPGGLGVAEGGIMGLSQVLLGLSKDSAAAAALLIRFCTLWFGLTLGTLMLMAMTRRMRFTPKVVPPEAQTL